MTFLIDMLSFAFIRRALLVGIFVSLCAALLGVSLVLKRFSMIGDGLSHVSFGALSVALAFGWAPLKFSIPIVAIAAFFLLRITERAKVKSDAAIAVVSASSLAIGIIVTALKTGINTDVASYMFGSILAMEKEDVWVSLILSIVVLGMFVICYHRIFAITFDENFAQATGGSVSFYNTLIAIITGRSGHADDGSTAHQQPDYLSGVVLHAAIQAVLAGHSLCSDFISRLFLCRHGRFVSVRYPCWSKRGCRKSGSIPAVLHHSEDSGTGQKTHPSSPTETINFIPISTRRR